MRLLSCQLLLIFLCGCAISPAGPAYFIARGSPGPERELVGVVNGLWRYTPEENEARLRKDSSLDEFSVRQLADRYMVRVGIVRGVVWGATAEYVLLPEGWKHSAMEVVDDSRTINVGDVVVLRAARSRAVDYLVRIQRKCNAPAGETERAEWNIGCVKVTSFDEPSGYGGKHYVFTVF